jgi:hypothetical protein
MEYQPEVGYSIEYRLATTSSTVDRGRLTELAPVESPFYQRNAEAGRDEGR